ncbi:hypothetical protein L208DRAFT_1375269 [Tricholoma matsutake]|nr:hypothetical protein L208DRAFT_1375269 [Tricholoma matsutake 945]
MEMKQWVEEEFPKRGDRPKALILWGPTWMGKMEWARSLWNHLYMGSMFNANALDEASDYVIFDNCDLGDLDMDYKMWIGGMDELYGSKTSKGKGRMKWGKLCIWLSNDDLRDCKKWDKEWVDGNAVVINLTHKLWM